MVDKVTTGIEGVDRMLKGGLIPKRPYIVSGPLGSGKTTLCMQFLLQGLKEGQRVLFVALEEPPNEIRYNMESYGWKVGDVEILDANSDIRRFEPKPILEISSEIGAVPMKNVPFKIRKSPEGESREVTVHSLQQALKNLFTRRDYQRVVIDSLTALRQFCMRDFEENVSTQSFIRFLTESGKTALMTVETPDNTGSKLETFLARGEIRLYKFRHENGIKRFISIEKYKGSSHLEYIVPMEIKEGGILVHAEEA
ncbi:MAG: RAD55 family ATPase [Thermoplasmata archaeon]